MNNDDLLQIAAKAGVLPHEMRHDPKHGLMLSAAGFRKVMALAPDQEQAHRVLKEAGANVGSVLKIDEQGPTP